MFDSLFEVGYFYQSDKCQCSEYYSRASFMNNKSVISYNQNKWSHFDKNWKLLFIIILFFKRNVYNTHYLEIFFSRKLKVSLLASMTQKFLNNTTCRMSLRDLLTKHSADAIHFCISQDAFFFFNSWSISRVFSFKNL